MNAILILSESDMINLLLSVHAAVCVATMNVVIIVEKTTSRGIEFPIDRSVLCRARFLCLLDYRSCLHSFQTFCVMRILLGFDGSALHLCFSICPHGIMCKAAAERE